MTNRQKWEIDEVIIRRYKDGVMWIAQDHDRRGIGATQEEALEELYHHSRNYIEEEYAD